MTKQDKRRITKLLESFDWLFGIQNWDRVITFMEKDEDDTILEITMKSDYQRVYLDIYPAFFTFDLEKQRKALLHEHCHLIPLGLQKIAYGLLDGTLYTDREIVYAKEHATSMVENLLHKFLTGGGKHYKRAYKEYLEGK